MATKKGWDQYLMMSLLKKEATYDAAVTVNASNFILMRGYPDFDPDWADDVIDDLDGVSGSEYVTDQEINTTGFKLPYSEPKARPSSIIGLVQAAFGSLTPTQDGGFTAYTHKGSPVSAGTALPSFNLIGKKGGIQYLFKGCKVNSIELASEEGGAVSLSADIIGSGSRATNADSFVTKLTEPRLLARHANIWREDGSNISIGATLGQGTEDISSATPDDLKARVKSWRWKLTNNLAGDFGHGSSVFQDLDYARRAVELSMTLRFSDSTELDQYLAQTALAFEVDVKHGSLVAAGGSKYWGFHLIVPKFQLSKAATPKGGVGDTLTVDIEGKVMDDGTNAITIFEGASAKAAYLAA